MFVFVSRVTCHVCEAVCELCHFGQGPLAWNATESSGFVKPIETDVFLRQHCSQFLLFYGGGSGTPLKPANYLPYGQARACVWIGGV